MRGMEGPGEEKVSNKPDAVTELNQANFGSLLDLHGGQFKTETVINRLSSVFSKQASFKTV